MSRALDVVVPAHDEQALVGACLRSLLRDAGTVDLRVIVVANGCTDATAGVVRALAGRAGLRAGRLVLVETPVAGKAAALDAGDAHRRGCPVMYLDGDTVLTPGTLEAVVTALEAPAPRLVSPPPRLVPPRGRLAAGFASVWSRLPAVAGQVLGAGCYAVNPAGRDRWASFPPLTADDAFVRSRFADEERRVLAEGGFLLVLPEGRELVRVVRRWRRGNAELADSPSAGTARNLAALLGHPALWPHLPAFLLVSLAARVPVRSPAWERADRLRGAAGDATGAVRPRVRAVQPGGADPGGIRSRWADVAVTAAEGTEDYVLVVFAPVDAGTVDELLALALRFPDVGLYRTPGPAGALLVDRARWGQRRTDGWAALYRSAGALRYPPSTPIRSAGPSRSWSWPPSRPAAARRRSP